MTAEQSAYLIALPEPVRAAAVLPEQVPAVPRFNATVVSVHDGDTITVDVDLAVDGIHLPQQVVRLAGCNARELSAPGGTEARDNLRQLLPAVTAVVLTAVRFDNYGGRLDAVISYELGGVPRDLVTDLIAAQWVAPWNGRGAQPVPPWPRTVTP